ncbi:hypothetical protein PYW08_006290 [Mythimna loreyi]|uniref:Uncharacterized protein n=1 Tax=Mythimna loreyi TaxID=667449 RepID=A0ACC2QRB9_9NEOP|nr:hypothetical protein PYW08_006290 [Mythimna loreyi]
MIPKSVVICAILARRRKRKKRKSNQFWVHPLNSDRFIHGKFYTRHHKVLNFPKKFFDYYRMSVQSFEELVSIVGPLIKKEDTRLRLAVPVEERLSVTLR